MDHMGPLEGLEIANRAVVSMSIDDQGAYLGEIPWCQYPLFAATGWFSVHAMIGVPT